MPGMTKPRLPENLQACVEELAKLTFETFAKHKLDHPQGLSALYVMVQATEEEARKLGAKDDQLMGAEMFGRSMHNVWEKARR